MKQFKRTIINRLTLRARIFLGFGLLIGLLLGIAAYGSYGLSAVGEEIDKMDGIAGNANRLQELSLRMETIRRGLAEYQANATGAALHDVADAETRVLALLAESAEFTLSAKRRALFKEVAARLHAMMTDQERFSTLHDSGLASGKLMLADDDAVRAALARFDDKSGARTPTSQTDPSGDPATSPQPVSTSAQIVDVRLAVVQVEAAGLHVVAASDPVLLAAFKRQAADVGRTLASVEAAAPEAGKAAVHALSVSLAAYAGDVERTAAETSESGLIFSTRLLPTISAMQAASEKALGKLLLGFDEVNQRASATASSTLIDQLGLSAAATVIGIVLAILIAYTIIRPVKGMTAAMAKLASGDTSGEIPGRNSTDVIGEMARAVEVFQRQALENANFAVLQAETQRGKERRQRAMDMHTQDFGTSVSGVMDQFMAAASAMRQAASDVATGAQQTRDSTSSTAQGARSSSQDLQLIAAATEQMSANIEQMSRQVSTVMRSVQSAVERAEETNAKVADLSEAGTCIGDVVRIIKGIAAQTNLLALNATIEAARAGTAGKGFAVVAGEVKALAAQTAQATEEIAAQVNSILLATDEAVAAVQKVGSAIGEVDVAATAIAAAVQEQAAATREITRNVQMVTATTSAAAGAMGGVLNVVEETEASSRKALEASEEVGRTARTLSTEVGDFLTAISKGGEDERRLYERIDGRGAVAVLQIDGRSPVSARIVDLSRGGLQLLYECDASLGTDGQVTLPDGARIRCRVARNGEQSLGLAFRQDLASLALIDQALLAFSGGSDEQRAA